MTAAEFSTSAYSAQYWQGVEERELRLPWCRSCGRPHFPARPFCPRCWSDDVEWRASSGTGSVYSFTVVRANPPSAFAEDLPYVLAIILLDEGVRMMSHIVGPSDSLRCDARVAVAWKDLHGRTMPVFHLLEESS